MYHMKSIINHEEVIILPKCMYRVKNPYEIFIEDEINIGISDQVNKFLKVSNKKMAELEQRQDQLIKKLDILYDRIMTISSYCKPSSVKVLVKSETNLQTLPEEVVLVVSPDCVPWYLNYLLKNSSKSIHLSWHIHSSVPNEKLFKIQEFLKVVKPTDISNDEKINLRLIFKCVAADSELKLSSLSLPILGNVNILRYLAFAYSSVIQYNQEDYNVDSLLDLCHILERATEKNKEAILNKLFSQCKQWIYGNQFTIVDLAAYNVIKQWKNISKHVPKEWFNSCDKKCL